MREQAKAISTLGIAVITPKPDVNSNIPNFSLVILETLVHKSEQFVVKDDIIVKSYFQSCTIMSESLAVVLTHNKIITLSLDDLTQK